MIRACPVSMMMRLTLKPTRKYYSQVTSGCFVPMTTCLITAPIQDNVPIENKKPNRILVDSVICILKSMIRGTERSAKSNAMCRALRGLTTVLLLMQWRRSMVLPRVESLKKATGGLHVHVSANAAAMIYATSKARKVLWAIIQFRDVRPVRRRLNSVIDILMTPTVT